MTVHVSIKLLLLACGRYPCRVRLLLILLILMHFMTHNHSSSVSVMYSVLERVMFWLYFICDSSLWYAECAPAVERAWLLQRPSLDRKHVCAHGFGFRVLTGLTHIFGQGQKNRQEGDLSYLLEAPKSCLPGKKCPLDEKISDYK